MAWSIRSRSNSNSKSKTIQSFFFQNQPSRISSWMTIGTYCVLLSTTISSVQSLSMTMTMTMSNNNNNVIPTLRGKAFQESLPPLQPNTRRVYLMRHGQTDWNQQGLMQGGGFDIPLNDNGIAQAQAAASELSAIPMGVVASSHLQRSLQTANHVHAFDDNLSRLVDPRLGEMRFGEFEGTCIHGPNAKPEHQQRFDSMLQRMKQDVHLTWPGDEAESTMCVSKRGQAGITALLNKCPDERHICVVAHGRFNKILLATLLWNDPSRYVEIEQGNTCINVIDYNEETEAWNPVVLNYAEHAPNANAKKALREAALRKQQQQQQQQQEEAKTSMEQFNTTTSMA